MNKIIIWKMGWQNWVSIFFTIVLLTIAYWNGITDIIFDWDNREEYSHGYMLPFITIYFIWLKKNEILQNAFSPSWLGLLISMFALSIFIVGELSALFVLIQYSLILVLYGLALSIMGWPAVKPVLIPLFLLVFAIPLPGYVESSLSANLQLLSSKLGVAIIRFCDIPVYLEGNVIDLGVFKLQVVEACSGLRYLFPLMSLGFICAYMFNTVMWKRILIFGSTIPITIWMNSFRIGVIGVMVDRWGIGMAEGFLHDFEGWAIFMACMGFLFLEMLILSKIGKTDSGSFFEIFGLTEPDELAKGDCQVRKVSAPFIGIICLLVISIFVLESVDKRKEMIPERKLLSEFPDQFLGWTGQRSLLETKVLDLLQLSDYILSEYTSPDSNRVNFYVAYYQSQRKGVAPHSPRVCIPGGGWEISDIDRIQVGEIPINRLLIKKENSMQLVYYWFQQRGRLIANEYLMKWYLFEDALFSNRTDGALVRISTPVISLDTMGDAEERLSNFAQNLQSVLPEYIPN